MDVEFNDSVKKTINEKNGCNISLCGFDKLKKMAKITKINIKNNHMM